MSVVLTYQAAQNIVDSIKAVCGHDINFINEKGIIFASTASSRIGDYHEIGKKVIESNQAIEINSDSSFLGTKAGVNIPFFYDQNFKAVIGISGPPDEVRKFADLAIKISTIILKEQEMNALDYSKKSQLSYIVHSLVDNSNINQEYLFSFLKDLQLSPTSLYRTVLININYQVNQNTDTINNEILKTLRQADAILYTFSFPDEYVVILDENKYLLAYDCFKKLSLKVKGKIKIGIGASFSLFKQNESFETAKIAIKSLRDDNNLASFDELNLEILCGSLNDKVKENFVNQIVGKLTEEEIDLLKMYFKNNQSLVKTSQMLYIHKNTLQYKLNQIKGLTGYDPREFYDAISLYLAIKLK